MEQLSSKDGLVCEIASKDLDAKIENLPLSFGDKDKLRSLILDEADGNDTAVASVAVHEYVTIVENVMNTPEVLHNNVIDTQMEIIEKSAKIYNFVDFL